MAENKPPTLRPSTSQSQPTRLREGWRKPVAPPKADSRPGGLPKGNPPRPASNTQPKENNSG